MKQKTKKRSKGAKKGSAILLSMILLFVVLALVASLSYVTVLEQKMSGKTKSSVGAFYNSESGVEWALNKIANGDNDLEINNPANFGTQWIGNHANCPFDDCSVYLLESDGTVIVDGGTALSEVKAVRSVGIQGGETQRAIEAAVAAVGGGCYVSYGNPPAGNRAAAPNENCVTGFTDKGSVGNWGECRGTDAPGVEYAFFVPPAAGVCNVHGSAYLCCQN